MIEHEQVRLVRMWAASASPGYADVCRAACCHRTRVQSEFGRDTCTARKGQSTTSMCARSPAAASAGAVSSCHRLLSCRPVPGDRRVPAGTFFNADRKRHTQCIEGSDRAVRAYHHNATFVRQPVMMTAKSAETSEPSVASVAANVARLRRFGGGANGVESRLRVHGLTPARDRPSASFPGAPMARDAIDRATSREALHQ